MIDAIFGQDGTLVGYRGDGLLAVFGAPIAARRSRRPGACGGARDARGATASFQSAGSREQGLGDGFEMGIGLNSGPFMSGNVGSARRLEYTVHGDTVNTASRIEGMTKRARRSLLIAESTYRSLSEPPEDLAFVGKVEVRGRQSTVSLWTLRWAQLSDARSPATR